MFINLLSGVTVDKLSPLYIGLCPVSVSNVAFQIIHESAYHVLLFCSSKYKLPTTNLISTTGTQLHVCTLRL